MASNFSSADQGLIAVSVGNQSAGSAVTLKDADGNTVAEVTPELDYAVVYISTADMAKGSTYTLSAGSYSESITLSDNIYSNISGGMQGGFGGGSPRGGMNGEMNGQMPEGGHGGGMRQGGGPGNTGSTDQVTGATQEV